MAPETETPFPTCDPFVTGGLNAGRLWLVCNAASGSNDARSRQTVCDALTKAGFTVSRVLNFPDDPAPDPADLAADGIQFVATFGGDGTVHAVVTGLFGWDGAMLVLPGGTMNLLSKALHGPASADEIAARLGAGQGRRVRPPVIHSQHAKALTGVLAGPGTIWNEVREAMRAGDLVEFVAATSQAISHSTTAPKITCAGAEGGREEGYAAIALDPVAEGMEAKGYYAESLADFAGQGIALLNRDFRDGPHDDLGRRAQVRLVCPEGEPMGLLIDGEPFDGKAEEVFTLARCGVDLMATLETNQNQPKARA